MSVPVELPVPLTPPDCDLRGLQFIPLFGDRLVESDFWFLSSGDEFKAAVALWWASWKQVPAGSLPENEKVLAGLSKISEKKWRAVREVALRGWIKCSDGRLYHKVVAEVALEAWEDRQSHNETKAGERERKKRERDERKQMFETLRLSGINMPWNTTTAELRAKLGEPRRIEDHRLDSDRNERDLSRGQVPDIPRSVTAIEGKEEGYRREEKKEGNKVPEPVGSAAQILDADKSAWDAAVNLLTDRAKMTVSASRAFFGKLISEHGLAAKDLFPAVATATANSTQDPKSYLAGAAARISNKRPRLIDAPVGDGGGPPDLDWC